MRTLHLSGNGNDALTITSSDEEPEPWYWRVTVHNDGLTASTDVELDSIRHTVSPIGEFFAALAADWRGWAGERTWGGTPITLTATHDGLGHITLIVDLEERYDSWRARAEFTLEAGRLDQIARDAAQLPTLAPHG